MSAAGGAVAPGRPGDRDPAPVADRVAAAAIDLLPILVALAAALVVWTVTGWPVWVALALAGAALAWAVASWWGAAADGRSTGKRLVGLREVDPSTGDPPGAATALARSALRGALAVTTLGIAGLSYRWDPAGRGRTWWDRMTGTVVMPGGSGVGHGERAAARWAPPGDGHPAAPGLGHSAAPADGHPVPPGPGHQAGTGATGGWVPPPVPAAVGAAPEPLPEPPPVPPLVPRPVPPLVPLPMPPPRDGGLGFLAKPLIGDGSRAVPGDRETPPGAGGSARQGGPITGGRSTGGPIAGGPIAGGPITGGLITGIGDTGAPILGGAAPAASPGPRHRAAAPPDPLRTVRIRAPEAELVWDTGRHVTVTGRALIGREPAPADGEHADHLLPVSTYSVGVSKTHLHLDVGRDGITVTDRRSTNGVRLVHPDGSVTRCRPGEAVPVEPGDVVHFGGRHITVAR